MKSAVVLIEFNCVEEVGFGGGVTLRVTCSPSDMMSLWVGRLVGLYAAVGHILHK